MKYFSCIILLLFCSLAFNMTVQASGNRYVGSKQCRGCHENEYDTYTKYARKATSFESIMVMKPKLTREEFETCFECHTTGYGKKGGFISPGETPDLKNAGCEVCHGPGSRHIELDGDIDAIKHNLVLDDCTKCHNKDRIKAFGFKPLLFGGAH